MFLLGYLGFSQSGGLSSKDAFLEVGDGDLDLLDEVVRDVRFAVLVRIGTDEGSLEGLRIVFDMEVDRVTFKNVIIAVRALSFQFLQEALGINRVFVFGVSRIILGGLLPIMDHDLLSRQLFRLTRAQTGLSVVVPLGIAVLALDVLVGALHSILVGGTEAELAQIVLLEDGPPLGLILFVEVVAEVCTPGLHEVIVAAQAEDRAGQLGQKALGLPGPCRGLLVSGGGVPVGGPLSLVDDHVVLTVVLVGVLGHLERVVVHHD